MREAGRRSHPSRVSVQDALSGINRLEHCTRMHLQTWFAFGKLVEGRCPQDLPIAFAVGVDFFVEQNNVFPLPVICPLIPAPQHCCSDVIVQHLR